MENPNIGVGNGVVEEEEEIDDNGQLGNGNNIAPGKALYKVLFHYYYSINILNMYRFKRK